MVGIVPPPPPQKGRTKEAITRKGPRITIRARVATKSTTNRAAVAGTRNLHITSNTTNNKISNNKKVSINQVRDNIRDKITSPPNQLASKPLI